MYYLTFLLFSLLCSLWHARPGAVDVFVRPPIETANWCIEDLVANKERIRDYYLEWHRSFAR